MCLYTCYNFYILLYLPLLIIDTLIMMKAVKNLALLPTG